MNKSQGVLANYETITADENARVPEKHHAYAKQFVPGRLGAPFIQSR